MSRNIRVKYKLIMLCIWAACAIAGLISMVQMLWSIVVGSPKAWRLAKAFDRVGNAATGGDDRETISSRAHRAQLEGRRWGCILCKLLDNFDKNHCEKSSGV